MMTEAEIYRNALENLRSTAERQNEMLHRYPQKAPEWRAKLESTRAKVKWLESILSLWEVGR